MFVRKGVRFLATIKTAIQMYNGMSPVLQSMTNALNIAISSFETMQNVADRAVDTRSLQAARAELNKAEVAFNQIEQEIKQADQAQQRFNSSIRDSRHEVNRTLDSIKIWATSIGAGFGIKSVVQMSDDMTLAASRLDLMNDKLQTTATLQDIIFQSAQRARSLYPDTLRTVSMLGILAGDAFSSSKEIVAFAEQMNKQFKIGGASLIEQTAAMYQLTQAMASGRLQGDEFRSIRENAPLLAKSIENYMINVGVEGTMKEWSAEGLITADVIKNAMFAVADETEERFRRLPMTWGQVWVVTVNNIIRYSQPLLDFINLLANNWGIIRPIVLGVVSALLLYLTATKGAALVSGAFTAIQTFLSIGFGILAGNTAAASAAMFAYNSVLLASPITWIIFGIIALIAIFYAAVAAVNKFAGTTYSATGMIAGAIAWAGAFIANIFIGTFNLAIDIAVQVVNFLLGFAEFFANFLNDPAGSIVRLIANMVDTVLGMLQGVASALDTIFGSNLVDTVEKWRSGLDNMVVDLVGEAKIKMERINPQDLHLDRYGLIDAYKTGEKWGRKFESKLSFGNLSDTLNDIYNGVGDIAANTGKAADALEMSEEDLKYLRDVAEREVIDRTVLRDVKVTLTNSFGDIRETADIDGIINKLETRLAEAIVNEAEGSYDSV